MEDEKRYALTLDVYIYAKSDKKAVKKARKLIRKLEALADRPDIISLDETPFACLTSRKITI